MFPISRNAMYHSYILPMLPNNQAEKFIDEARYFTIDWTANIGSDNITSVTSVTISPSGLTINSGSTVISGKILSLWFNADGVIGTNHVVYPVLLTSSGQTVAGTFRMLVKGNVQP